MVKYRLLFFCFASLFTASCFAQTWGSNPELNKFEQYYVKSLNEFMHRFNAEEVPPFIKENGGTNLRHKCILALFDLEQAPSIESEAAKRILRFDSVVCAQGTLLHIDMPGLYAEAHCVFKYKKKEIEFNLILVYERIKEDYFRWTIAGVNGLEDAGLLDTTRRGYINPVNHELHFSELESAFPHINGDFEHNHNVDKLSFVAGLAESEALKLIGCQSVTYWFTQIPGYLFSVSLHPRFGGNAGWLIHDLIEISEDEKSVFIKELKGTI